MAAGVSANDQPPILNTDQCFFLALLQVYMHTCSSTHEQCPRQMVVFRNTFFFGCQKHLVLVSLVQDRQTI